MLAVTHIFHIFFAHSSYYLQRELVYEIIRIIKAFRAKLFPVSTISFHSAFSVRLSRGACRMILKMLSLSNSK